MELANEKCKIEAEITTIVDIYGKEHQVIDISEIRKDSLDAYFKDGKNLVTISNLGASGKIETYNGSTANCLDCRLKGSSIKPAFW